MRNEDLLYVLALQKTPLIGDVLAKRMIRKCGSAKAVFDEKKGVLQSIEGVGGKLIKELTNPGILHLAEEELKFIEDHDIEYRYFEETDYPAYLKQCLDGPILIFESGRINIKDQPIISVVGTRRITYKGIAFCEKLIDRLALYNPIIVSGFAYGTDITAQRLAMEHNLQTIGCLAHGLNQIYPKPHSKYVETVKEHGGFITDFWSSDPFERTNFIKRNRIIAGMSEATVVIESAAKGGSLVTADLANSYNREVFAVPGRIDDELSEGCNTLIKTNRARLLSQPEDIPYILNWSLNEKNEVKQPELFDPILNAEEKQLYDYLKGRGLVHLDQIVAELLMPISTISAMLLTLELKGLVRPFPGKYFERN